MDLVTGGTGLLGSHIVEHLLRADRKVRALVRDGSDTSWLKSQGVELATGHLQDEDSLAKACEGVDVVFHSAAKVGDWGNWPEFQEITINGTERLLKAAHQARVKRFVHISSISCYGHPENNGQVLDETDPVGQNLYRWSYYTKSKVVVEKMVLDFHKEHGLPVTIIRPSWLFGERDRITVARVVNAIRTGGMKLMGDGSNLLSAIYAGNVAQGCVLAARKDVAIGQIYNLSNNGKITQKELFDLYAKNLDCPPVEKKLPFKLALFAGFMMEVFGRLLRSKKPPLATRYAVWLMGRKVYFSTDKARQQLGWEPEVSYEDGVKRTVEWFLQQEQTQAAPE